MSKVYRLLRIMNENAAYSLVMRGLDPRIHHLRKSGFLERWIAGSSPAMTSEFA
jgi:hypothetical protein